MDGIPSPSAHDPARNRHRDKRSWSKIVVRWILKNPRYTGRQVWNRQRRDEVLVDIEDVAAGYESKLRWNDASEWVWSKDESHEAILRPKTFEAVKRQMSAGAHRPHSPKRHTTARTYVLSGLVHCVAYGHRIQGGVHHGNQNYRCRFTRDFALPRGMDHPGVVFVREDAIVPKLDEWIVSLFAPRTSSKRARPSPWLVELPPPTEPASRPRSASWPIVTSACVSTARRLTQVLIPPSSPDGCPRFKVSAFERNKSWPPRSHPATSPRSKCAPSWTDWATLLRRWAMPTRRSSHSSTKSWASVSSMTTQPGPSPRVQR